MGVSITRFVGNCTSWFFCPGRLGSKSLPIFCSFWAYLDAVGAFLAWLGRGGVLPPSLGLVQSASQQDKQKAIKLVWTEGNCIPDKCMLSSS